MELFLCSTVLKKHRQYGVKSVCPEREVNLQSRGDAFTHVLNK